MPLPFQKLLYGERQRLRELSTPVEVYDLQLAVGNDLVGLLPMQETKNGQMVIFHEDDALPVEVYNHVNDEMPTLIPTGVVVIVQTMLIRSLFSAVSHPLFGMLYFKNAWMLSINVNDLIMNDLRFLAYKMPNLMELTLEGHLEDLNYVEIRARFPNLRYLESKQLLSHDWVVNLINADFHDIKVVFSSENNGFANIFNFVPADLLQLLTKRCNINVVCDNPDNETREAQAAMITEYLGPSFIRLTDFVQESNFAVRLYYVKEPYNPDSPVKTAIINYAPLALYDGHGYVHHDTIFNFSSDSDSTQYDYYS